MELLYNKSVPGSGIASTSSKLVVRATLAVMQCSNSEVSAVRVFENVPLAALRSADILPITEIIAQSPECGPDA